MDKELFFQEIARISSHFEKEYTISTPGKDETATTFLKEISMDTSLNRVVRQKMANAVFYGTEWYFEIYRGDIPTNMINTFDAMIDMMRNCCTNVFEPYDQTKEPKNGMLGLVIVPKPSTCCPECTFPGKMDDDKIMFRWYIKN